MSKSVGIVIPSYNQGIYLDKAIESVIQNKKNADIKIAVVDGGSDDDSLDIINAHRDELDYWCSEKDNGQADAINKGIVKLQGCDYYMWLNSDDVYENVYSVRDIVKFAEEGNYNVVYGKSHFIDENDSIVGDYPIQKFSKKTLGKTCYLSQPSVLFSAEAVRNIGLLNVNLHMCLDYEYWIRLAQKYTFGFCDKYIGSTRLYSDTKTSTNQACNISEGLQVIYYYYHYYPIEWVTAAFVEANKNSLIRIIPKRLLMMFLYPNKNRIANKYIESLGIKYLTITKEQSVNI